MRKSFFQLTIVLVGLAGHSLAAAETYIYEGTVTLCTPTCDSFAALDVGSTVYAEFEIATTPSSAWLDADFGPLLLETSNPALPVSGPVGDPVNDNPLILDSSLGLIASNGSSGTTNAVQGLDSGTILLEFLVPPFSSNGAFYVMDVGTGEVKICLFYATAGCVPGATEVVVAAGAISLVDVLDSDGDGVSDDVDNCSLTANADQRDTNGDGYGNACDADLNNDGVVNVIDLGLMRVVFFTPDPDADLNGDGIVNFLDLAAMKSLFFLPPGPSAF